MKNLNIDLDKIKSFSFKSFSLPVNLQPRDKMALMVAAVVVGGFLILQLTVFPILDRRTRLRDDIKTSKAALAKMQLIRAEHGTLSRNTRDMDGALRRRPKNFTLFSFIDRLAGKNNIKQNITTMKPSNTNLKNSPYGLSTVEMKINALTMEQLTPFLHGIENESEMVWIKRISIAKGGKNDALLDVVLQVVTLQR